LLQGRKSVNIYASSGVIRGIPVKPSWAATTLATRLRLTLSSKLDKEYAYGRGRASDLTKEKA
jgi:hypothetical protein